MPIKPQPVKITEKLKEKPIVNKEKNKNIDNNKNNLNIKEIINKIKKPKPLLDNSKFKNIIQHKEKEQGNKIKINNNNTNNSYKPKPIKVNIIKKDNSPKKEISAKTIYSYDKKQTNVPTNTKLLKVNNFHNKEKLYDIINMVNKSDINLKENNSINNYQKWNKISEINNMKNNTISNTKNKEANKANLSAIITKKYIPIRFNINLDKNKTADTKIQNTNNNNKINTINSNKSSIKSPQEFKIEGNKSYKTSTYTSPSPKNNYNNNSGGKGTSIIITSSRINDFKEGLSNRGKIQHTVSLRSSNNNDNRENSTSKYTGKNYLNIPNDKNRSITIISSKEDIEFEKEEDKIKKRYDKTNTKINNEKPNKRNSGTTDFHFRTNNINNTYKNSKYVRTEPNQKDKRNIQINLKKDENKNNARNYFISPISKPNQSNVNNKNYFSNENKKLFISNNIKDENNSKNDNKYNINEIKKNIKDKYSKDNNNNLSNDNNKNNIYYNINSNNINTVFISSYGSNKLKDNKNEDKNKNENNLNTKIYNSNNSTKFTNNFKNEIKTNNENKDGKNNNTPKNIINNKIENNSSIVSPINSSKIKEESSETKENKQNIKDIQTYLLNREKNEKINQEKLNNLDDIKEQINKNINNVQISETKLNNDINKNERNLEEIKIEQDTNSHISDFNIEKELDKIEYDFLKKSPAENNVFNNLNLLNTGSKELYNKYDFLDTPGLSEYTKAFLTSQTSALKPELNIYTRAYLNSLGNDDDNNNSKSPELTKLTKEYLSKNNLLDDSKE